MRRALPLLLLLLTAAGDWRGDAPGVVHRIDPGHLPPPGTSAADSAALVPRPPGALPRVPAGFTVSVFAEGLEMPRAIRRAPDGSVFVAESGAGRLLRFTEAGERATFAEGLDLPYGIAFWPPAAPRFVYVAETGRVLRYPWRAGAPAPTGPAEVVVAALPSGGHWTRDLAVAPDGSRMFLAVGSEGNLGGGMGPEPEGGVAAWQRVHGLGAAWGAETGRAGVFWLRPEGGPLHPYAQGLRNCSGLAVQPGRGALWCVVNERDGLGDDLPPDYATRVHEGAFYGWPWFYLGPHPDPRREGERPDLTHTVTVPDVLFEAHSAPLGIVFYDATRFPRAYHGDAFVALHGSWNRSRRTGYKVVRLPMRGGHASGTYEDFMTGFVLSDDAVWGRPAGVAVAADGALLVSEDAHGFIWRVAPRSP
jgi:glucose/arabinose dehydrogenase